MCHKYFSGLFIIAAHPQVKPQTFDFTMIDFKFVRESIAFSNSFVNSLRIKR